MSGVGYGFDTTDKSLHVFLARSLIFVEKGPSAIDLVFSVAGLAFVRFVAFDSI